MFGLGTMVVQAARDAWVYPRLFDTAPDAWMASALRFVGFFGVLAWSLAVVPVAAKNRMSSVGEFLGLETAFTAVQYGIVPPLIALATLAYPNQIRILPNGRTMVWSNVNAGNLQFVDLSRLFPSRVGSPRPQ